MLGFLILILSPSSSPVVPCLRNSVCSILFAALGTDLTIWFRLFAARTRMMMFMIGFCAGTSFHAAPPEWQTIITEIRTRLLKRGHPGPALSRGSRVRIPPGAPLSCLTRFSDAESPTLRSAKQEDVFTLKSDAHGQRGSTPHWLVSSRIPVASRDSSR